MLLKLSQHQKAPNSITDQIFASKPATFRRRKTKPLYKNLKYQNMHSLLSVQNPESTIHSLKSSILTELQSLQISCPSSQKKKNSTPVESSCTFEAHNVSACNHCKIFCTPKQQSRCHSIPCPNLTPRHLLILTTSVILQQKILKTGSRKS